ncbi:hypothetical protein UlMin_030022 [Ulmus minor]
MGCFPACFSSSKRQKHHNTETSPLYQHQILETNEALQVQPIEVKQEHGGKLIELIRESKEEEVEEKVNNGAKRKVTFDLNVKAYEESAAIEEKENEETLKEKEQLSGAVEVIKTATFTPNNRYQDCRISTDEYETGLDGTDELEEEEEEKEEDKQIVIQEESSESLFSLSIDSRKQVCEAEMGEKEVSSPMLICSFSDKEVEAIGSRQDARNKVQFGHSVLNPIENLTQWKEVVKERHFSPPPEDQDKENVNLEQNFPSLKQANCSKSKLGEVKPKEQEEIGVDTSLSSWLVGSETKHKSGESDQSVGNSESEKTASNLASKPENRTIFQELKIEVLKQFSDSSSPKGSRSQSPDETPVIGTVGSYWIHTGQNMDSDSSSCREVLEKGEFQESSFQLFNLM